MTRTSHELPTVSRLDRTQRTPLPNMSARPVEPGLRGSKLRTRSRSRVNQPGRPGTTEWTPEVAAHTTAPVPEWPEESAQVPRARPQRLPEPLPAPTEHWVRAFADSWFWRILAVIVVLWVLGTISHLMGV